MEESEDCGEPYEVPDGFHCFSLPEGGNELDAEGLQRSERGRDGAPCSIPSVFGATPSVGLSFATHEVIYEKGFRPECEDERSEKEFGVAISTLEARNLSRSGFEMEELRPSERRSGGAPCPAPTVLGVTPSFEDVDAGSGEKPITQAFLVSENLDQTFEPALLRGRSEITLEEAKEEDANEEALDPGGSRTKEKNGKIEAVRQNRKSSQAASHASRASGQASAPRVAASRGRSDLRTARECVKRRRRAFGRKKVPWEGHQKKAEPEKQHASDARSTRLGKRNLRK